MENTYTPVLQLVMTIFSFSGDKKTKPIKANFKISRNEDSAVKGEFCLRPCDSRRLHLPVPPACCIVGRISPFDDRMSSRVRGLNGTQPGPPAVSGPGF